MPADIQGKVLLQQYGNVVKGSYILKFDVSHLGADNYLLILKTGNNSASQNINKEKFFS